jgi:DNA mismatch endonuclease, patch repair protein
MDSISKRQRSANMAKIRSRDTKPELVVRRLAHRLGYRFRLHRRELPGTPDLVFPALRKVIFVNGCFWHRHTGCRFASEPKSNINFWRTKFLTTLRRDELARRKLTTLGWGVLTIWECETNNDRELRVLLKRYLGQKYKVKLRHSKVIQRTV